MRVSRALLCCALIVALGMTLASPAHSKNKRQFKKAHLKGGPSDPDGQAPPPAPGGSTDPDHGSHPAPPAPPAPKPEPKPEDPDSDDEPEPHHGRHHGRGRGHGRHPWRHWSSMFDEEDEFDLEPCTEGLFTAESQVQCLMKQTEVLHQQVVRLRSQTAWFAVFSMKSHYSLAGFTVVAIASLCCMQACTSRRLRKGRRGHGVPHFPPHCPPHCPPHGPPHGPPPQYNPPAPYDHPYRLGGYRPLGDDEWSAQPSVQHYGQVDVDSQSRQEQPVQSSSHVTHDSGASTTHFSTVGQSHSGHVAPVSNIGYAPVNTSSDSGYGTAPPSNSNIYPHLV